MDASISLTIILSIWLVLSAVHQISSRIQIRLGHFDPLGLLPCWSFFAPNPGTSDYRVVYRNLREGDARAEWVEVPVYRPEPFRALWNPSKHRLKALSDLVHLLLRSCDALNGHLENLPLTWPYLALLGRVCAIERNSADITRRQFAIVSTSGYGESRRIVTLFVSAIHTL